MEKLNFAFVAMVLSLGFSLPVLAKDFQQRNDLDARSRLYGVESGRVQLLERVDGPGVQSIATKIVEKYKGETGPIATAGAYKVEIEADRMKVMGNGWIVISWGTGN